MAAAYVQSASAFAAGDDDNIAVTLNSVAAGNCIVVAAFIFDTSEAWNTCSDGTNTYTAAFAHVSGDLSGGRIWVAPNVSSGNFTITATLASGSNSYRAIFAHEVSGIVTSSPVDVSSTSSFSDDSGSATPSVDGCYIFGTGYTPYSSTAFTSGGSFTQRQSQTDAAGVACASQDQVQATAASISSNFTVGDNGGVGMMVAIKPAGGAAATNPGWYSSRGGWW